MMGHAAETQKGWSNASPSSLISPRKQTDDTASSSAEDGDASSLEVKENQDEKRSTDCSSLQKHPSAFSSSHGSRALKRKQVPQQSQPTCKRAAWAVTQKNALVQLNELRPGLRYEMVSKTGPLHAPVFSVGVEVNGFRFEGVGRSKKQAKMRAAELALHSFIQFPNASQAHAAMGNFTSSQTDFTADKPDISDAFPKEFEPKKAVFSSICNHRRLVRLTLGFAASENPKRRALSSSLLQRLSPVMLLDQLRPGLRYTCLTERVPNRLARSFVMAVRVEGAVFEGCAHSKRQAKAQAAAGVLKNIYNLSLGPERIMGLQDGRSKNQLPQFFAESVFHLVREKLTELTDGFHSPSNSRHKVVAGIVMTRGFDLRSARVVCLATGSKCLDSEVTFDLGGSLRDCHAEVVCRRALVRFLYAQLESLLREPSHCEEPSIFVPKNAVAERGNFRLRDGVLFHMYVSSSPCGDARLNCPYESLAALRSRRFRCHLRVKVDGGEGTLPLTARRTKPVTIATTFGKPPLTMSCTDKIAKWSALGLQGALLSHLVEPVYLHSLTVGTLSHTGHLSRAIARRLALLKILPFPFRKQRLLLSCLSSSDVRPPGKNTNMSLNWSRGDGGVEEVSASTGRRTDSGTPSRLCRRHMFARWQRLQRQIKAKTSNNEATSASYSDSKMGAERYQRAMHQFGGALQSGGLGTWLRKPPQL